MTTPPDTPKPSEFPPREIWVWIDGEGYYEVRDEQPNKVAERYILAPSPQESHKLAEELERRITAYLVSGGLFNPELANHDAVRNLLIDCRDTLAALRSSPSEQEVRLTKQQAAIVGAYTGIAFGPFSDVHGYVEKLLGRPVWTHEFADKELWKVIREAAHPDMLAIAASWEAKEDGNG